MRTDFRERVFTPILLPLTILGAILAFAFSFSRVLLAVEEVVAAFVGLFLAAYILAVAALVSARPRISTRALGVGLGLGLAGVVLAGVVAAAAGMRPLHEEEAAAVEESPAAAAQGNEPGPAELPEDAVVFVTDEIAFTQAPEMVPAGEELTVGLRNTSNLVHNVVIEELGDELIVEAQAGETVTGTVTLESGEYTYYCSVPGHRESGMEGTVTAG